MSPLCHFTFSPSSAATTVAPVSDPVTLVIVRNISGTRSSPMSSVSPASGSPVAVNAGARLTILADGTLATVSEARNTAAPAWIISGTPRTTPYRRAANRNPTARNRALPHRVKLAPRGSAEVAQGREGLRARPAAAPHVGRREIGQRATLFLREPGGGDREDGGKDDQRQQVAVDRRPHRIRGYQLHQEARPGGDLFRRVTHQPRVGERRLAQRRLLIGCDSGERQK